MYNLKKILPANREARRTLLLIGFGFVALPVLVYAFGALTLGTSDTSFWAYLQSLYGSLFRLRPSAWALVLGPYLLFSLLRFTSRPLRRRAG